MKLPTFSGGSDKDDLPPRDFVERIEAYCKALKKDTNDECTEMQLALRGNATIWWRSLARRGISNGVWADVKQEFLSTYQPSVTGKTAHAIGQLEQKGTETINDYFNRLDQVIDEMMASATQPTTSTKTIYDNVRNHIQKYLFIGGLRENLRIEVQKTEPTSLAEALKAAGKTELILKRETSKIFSVEDNPLTPTGNDDDDLDDEEIAALNAWRAKRGKKPMQRRNTNLQDVKCYNCNKMGHISRNCRAPRKAVRSMDEQRNNEKQEEDTSQEERNYVQSLRDGNNMDFW